MGAAGSKGTATTLDNPFPLDPTQNRNLDKLSMAAARILATADIYDFSNLAKPGVCGEYAVFLKKDLTRKLLPFVAQVSPKEGAPAERTEVYYQTSSASIPDRKVREKICGDMVDTMLRVCATVVACLASMQVATASRDTAMAGIGAQAQPQAQPYAYQRGGAADFKIIAEWLVVNGYIKAPPTADPVGIPLQILKDTRQLSSYSIVWDKVTDGAIIGDIYKQTTPDAKPMVLPIRILNPISLSGGQSVLPFFIKDSKERVLMVGVLSGREYKSLYGPTPVSSLIRELDILFSGGFVETQSQINTAFDTFMMLRRGSDQLGPLNAAIGLYLQSKQGLGYGGQPQPLYGLQPPYGPAPLPIAAAVGPAAYPGGYGAWQQQQQRLYQPAQAPILRQQQIAFSSVGARGPTYYIPEAASKLIDTIFKGWRTTIPKQSSPAAVRALTLRGAIDPATRTVLTGVCRDPYWTQPSPKDIFPWATFQFLAVKNWGALTAERRGVQFESEWDDFLTKLQKLYSDKGSSAPRLERPAGAMFLDQMKLTGVDRIELCQNSGGTPRVAFQEVQLGLQKLQAVYNAHIKKMWTILNELITIIVDPETRTEVVRLHPKVLSADQESSKAYVEAKAKTAREDLREFYLKVEETYIDSLQSLKRA
jgi:hypothetical protein